MSKVTNMKSIFSGTNFQRTIFNQDISSWNVSNVTNMDYMFQGSSFNQDISSWSVNGVTNCDGFSINTPLTEANIHKFTNCIP